MAVTDSVGPIAIEVNNWLALTRCVLQQEGRSALIVAAIHGHVKVAQLVRARQPPHCAGQLTFTHPPQLLENGVSVHHAVKASG